MPVTQTSTVEPSARAKADSSPAASEAHSKQPLPRAITWRAVALSLLLALFFGYFNPIIDMRMQLTFLGGQHLPAGSIATLLLLIGVVNPLLKLMRRAWALRREESLTIFITTLFSTLVPGHGAENTVVSFLIGPFYFATRENKSLDRLQELPTWMSPALWADGNGTYGERGQKVVSEWFLGNGGAIPWAAWTVPMLAWGALIVAIYFASACLMALLRAQWARNEALAFPILRLPLAMTDDLDAARRTGFWRDGLMWIGAGGAIFIQLLNGLAFYFPEVPGFPLALNAAPFLSEPPWNQIGPVDIVIYPVAIGLAFLLTTEVSFSLWFFYWAVKFQYIALYMAGFTPGILPMSFAVPFSRTFVGYQHIGAFLMFAVLLFWTGRGHLSHVARRALGREKPAPDEAREPMSYPFAFWGFVAASLFILGWTCAAGVRWDVALITWSLYAAVTVVLTRVIAETGLLFVHTGFTPIAWVQLFGTGPGATWLGPSAGLTVMSAIHVPIMVGMRAIVAPSFLHAFKIAHDENLPARRLLWLIGACTAITLVMGLVMRIKLGYEHGGLSFHPYYAKSGPEQIAGGAATMARGVEGVSAVNWLYLALGGALTWGMLALRAHFAWFALHPVGYIMAVTYPMRRLWLSVFIGWTCKALINRFGGTLAARRATNLFLGLALGDVMMMIFWIAIDAWQGRQGHYLLPP